jgi:hypothetical protein
MKTWEKVMWITVTPPTLVSTVVGFCWIFGSSSATASPDPIIKVLFGVSVVGILLLFTPAIVWAERVDRIENQRHRDENNKDVK